MELRKEKESIICYNSVDEELPTFLNKEGDAGYDLYITKDTYIFPFVPKKVPLNLRAEIPMNFFGMVTGRSGESLFGNVVIPGIIDPNYRGQMSAIMFRVGLLPKKLKRGTRVAQLLIIPYANCRWSFKRNLSKTNRDIKGFGSSGKY